MTGNPSGAAPAGWGAPPGKKSAAPGARGATATGAQVQHQYTAASNAIARLTVEDPGGQQGHAQVLISPGNTPPQVTAIPPGMPISAASWNAAPSAPTCSPTASAAGITPTDGWPICAKWVSS